MSVIKSITKSIDINVNINNVFEFISNPLNWPKWAVVNLKSISEGKDGWYEMETRQGRGQLKMLAEKTHGILDHLWKDTQASWVVPARVVQNDMGCTFIITFFKPSVMSDEMFEFASGELDVELAMLKKILEKD